MGNKKVSIIVPVYNAEEYVERCINSVLAQTYENVEIIIVDDGSTDESVSICDNFSARHENIRVFHTKNAGVSSARNRGISEACEDYLTFVDADDYLEKDTVAYLVRCLEETKSDIAGCGFQTFSQGEVLRENQRFPDNIEVLSGEEFVDKGILNGDTRCWSKLYKREIIGSTRYDETLTIGEDMLFLLALAQKKAQFCRSDYKGYGYFINAAGAMNRKFKESYMDQITCWQRAEEEIVKVYPNLKKKVTSILMISAMLVVGKLAELSGKDRMNYNKNIKVCLEQIHSCMKVNGAYSKLSSGYKVKVMVFKRFPGVYLWAYHMKSLGNI